MSEQPVPRDARNVMASRKEPADSLDMFPTPPWATRALCEGLIERGFSLDKQTCWEPACGMGHMARPLAEYFEAVFSSDIHDYGHGNVQDFIAPYDGPTADWIITNPPFRLAEQFALTAIKRARSGVALIVRTAFLESVGRYERLFEPHLPAFILQFCERVPMHRGRLEQHGSTATAYCWIVWASNEIELSASGLPFFRWIPQCRRSLERPEDYTDSAPVQEAMI